ncbi:MAG: LPS assembly lipoprotein LptE [Wenzhouxiangellaceae bacterium]
MKPEAIVRLLCGRLPAFGGARNPHVFSDTLRLLRAGERRQTPARYVSRPLPGTGRMPTRPVFPALAALGLVLVLTGCGFQLRGTANLPEEMATTWVQVEDPTSAFARELELRLRGNGVELAESPGEGVAELHILRERITRRALTISEDARVREFELVFDLRFRLVGPSGDSLLGPESLRMRRDFQFDEQEILGAATEEEMSREELRRSMAAALIRRLEAFGRT